MTKVRDKIPLKSNDAYVDNMLSLLGMESSKPTLSVDAWRSVRGWLVSNAETNSVQQW